MKMKTCKMYEIRKWDSNGCSAPISLKLRSLVRARRLVARLRSRNIPCFAAPITVAIAL